jgi:glutamine phosphoribosylpyrophosphate amidotransferase
MFKAMPLPKEKFCAACFTANYPTKLAKNFSKYMFEKNRGK